MNSVAKELGTCHKQIRRWVGLYERYGEDGLDNHREHYSDEFKLSVVLDKQENHLSLYSTAMKYGIANDGTILYWERKYNREGAAGFCGQKQIKMNQKQIKAIDKTTSDLSRKELLLEVERLRAENAYLKKLRALIQDRISRTSESAHEPSVS